MSSRVLLFVGTSKGLFVYSADRSRRFWNVEGPYLPGWEVTTLRLDPRRGPRLFAGTTSYPYGATIRVSDDFGESWKQVPAGPAYDGKAGGKLNRIWQIVPGHESEPDTLFAGVDEAGLFVSRDAGETWSPVDALNRHPTRGHWFPGAGGLCLHTILIDRADARRMWVGISAVGVFRSVDGGASWEVRNTGLPPVVTDAPPSELGRCVHRMVLDPERPDTLYQQYHRGVFRSGDGADTWEAIENGLPGNFGFPMAVTAAGHLFVIPLESDEVRMVRDGQLHVFRSSDRGRTWELLGNGLPAADCYVGVLRDAMDVDPLDPAGVYFGTTMGQVFASASNGNSWVQLPGQLPRVLSVRAWVVE